MPDDRRNAETFEALAIPLLAPLYNFAHWLTANRDRRSIHLTATNAFVPSAELRARVQLTGGSRRVRLQWSSSVALAAITAVVIIGVVLWPGHSDHSDVLVEIADMHVATLASVNPVDVVSTDRHTVKPWFGRQAAVHVQPARTAKH